MALVFYIYVIYDMKFKNLHCVTLCQSNVLLNENSKKTVVVLVHITSRCIKKENIEL